MQAQHSPRAEAGQVQERTHTHILVAPESWCEPQRGQGGRSAKKEEEGSEVGQKGWNENPDSIKLNQHAKGEK